MVTETTSIPTRGSMVSRRRLLGAGLGAAVAASGLIVPAGAQAQSGEIVPANPDGSTEDSLPEPPSSTGRYFAETGHNLRDPFLSRWQSAGGAEVLGMPIAEERFVEEIGVVQTFETVSLVYDPSNEPPWDIYGQELSGEVRAELAPANARRRVADCSAGASCRYFPETEHTIAGAIADFWARHGDVPLFGLPVSEPFTEDGVMVQVFERAVIEQPEGGDARLRPVALAQADLEGLLGSEAFVPAPPNGGTTSLVNASDGLRLRAGPGVEAGTIAVLPDSAEFIAAPGEDGEWLAGYVDGYAGWVAAEWLREPPPLPSISRAEWDLRSWQGATLSETNVRAEPTTESPMVDELIYGDPVKVIAWVEGEEVFEGADLWAELENRTYVYGRNVGRSAPVAPPPVPADAPSVGKWIDVHLTQQLMVAYDGRNPVRTTLTTTGMAGWETPPGFFAINNRVANETMDSGAIGAEHFYKLEDVLFTQYFTDRGHALHFAWWRTPETIGRPGSHGCLNLLLDDARFFWDWADLGTPVYCHY